MDNSTTAMTGHQPHPGIGKTVMGEEAEAISISAVLKAVGVKTVLEVNPLDHEAAVSAVRQAAEQKGVRAIIFRSPCIAKEKRKKRRSVETESCIGCRKCIRELGCPAIFMEAGKAKIDKGLCTGCGLCASVCPEQCMKEVEA